MANDVSLSEQQLMEIINQAKSISLGEATEAQKNFAQSVDDRDDPDRAMRSRFERPAMPTPTPMPTPSPAGLMPLPKHKNQMRKAL